MNWIPRAWITVSTFSSGLLVWIAVFLSPTTANTSRATKYCDRLLLLLLLVLVLVANNDSSFHVFHSINQWSRITRRNYQNHTVLRKNRRTHIQLVFSFLLWNIRRFLVAEKIIFFFKFSIFWLIFYSHFVPSFEFCEWNIIFISKNFKDFGEILCIRFWIEQKEKKKKTDFFSVFYFEKIFFSLEIVFVFWIYYKNKITKLDGNLVYFHLHQKSSWNKSKKTTVD